MTQPISRRTIAKGAAWAAPTVAFAASAPAFAASAFTAVCPDAAKVMTMQGGSWPSISSYVTGDGTYPGGTYAGLNAGQWNVPATSTTSGANTTGYRLNWGATTQGCNGDSPTGGGSVKDAVHIITQTGAAAKGKLTLGTPNCTPQVAGAGLATSLGIQYSAPYSGDVCGVGTSGKAMQIKNISIPFTITYLTGLSGNYTSASNFCSYYLNMTFPSGCQANTATAYSITSAPLY